MNKTLREAFAIMLVALLLALLCSVLSPVGRILLKKGLGIKTTGAASEMTSAFRGRS